jgi:hypothetical protein
MRQGLYCIYDRLAGIILGPVQLHRHDAAAVRTFDEIARMENSTVGRHPADFALIRVGHLYIDEEVAVHAETVVILEGSQWAAMNVVNAETP